MMRIKEESAPDLSSVARLKFFKLFREDECSENLLLPVPAGTMNRIMNGKEDDSVVLYGPDGRRWPVVVERRDADWLFMEGWEVFVEGNSVVEKDTMFFTLFGDRKFRVDIVGPDGIDKVVEHASRKRRKVRHLGASRCDTSNGVGVSSEKRPRGRAHVATPTEQMVADSFSSDRPFLIRDLVWEQGKFPVMFIPKCFLKKHSLTLHRNQEIVLRGRKNSPWKVKVNEIQGAFSFGKGFPRFLHRNVTSHGNTLVYEVINGSTMEMRVHFYA